MALSEKQAANVYSLNSACHLDSPSRWDFIPQTRLERFHSRPYAATDVKAVGLRLSLAVTVRRPSEEGLYTRDK